MAADESGALSTSPQPTMYVLATTEEGTRCGLLTAKRLTKLLGARIGLLVPRPHSVFAPFDPTSDERTTLLDEHQRLAADVGVHVTTLFCVCHRLDDAVHQMVGRSGLVIVGGRRHGLWRSREQRLVGRLTREAYAVVFAEVGAEPRHALMPATSA